MVVCIKKITIDQMVVYIVNIYDHLIYGDHIQ